MSVDITHLTHLCSLSALTLSVEQQEKFIPQLDAVVSLVSRLEHLELGEYHTDEVQIGHTLSPDAISDECDMFLNMKHPTAGHMPSISFTTRGD